MSKKKLTYAQKFAQKGGKAVVEKYGNGYMAELGRKSQVKQKMAKNIGIIVDKEGVDKSLDNGKL